jgi:hypothetical protein
MLRGFSEHAILPRRNDIDVWQCSILFAEASLYAINFIGKFFYSRLVVMSFVNVKNICQAI